MSLLHLLFPRTYKPAFKGAIEKFDELQRELEKRVDRLEGTKAQLLSHANGAMHNVLVKPLDRERCLHCDNNIGSKT
jgi:hypothetical protein